MLVLAGFITGKIAHECLHWGLAAICGGTPEFTDWDWLLPGAVDFHTPENLSDRQIQLVGGGVLIFPMGLLMISLWITPDQIIGWSPILAFFARASGISDYDLMATVRPGVWRKLNMGEDVNINEFGSISEEPRFFGVLRSTE